MRGMRDTFESTRMDDKQIEDVAAIRYAAYALETAIYNASMQDRYRAIAITQLEITVMVANKAISRVNR